MMDDNADIVAICITCCTVTGIIFGIGGMLFGRMWALKWCASHDECDQDEKTNTPVSPDVDATIDVERGRSVRYRPNSSTAKSNLSFL